MTSNRKNTKMEITIIHTDKRQINRGTQKGASTSQRLAPALYRLTLMQPGKASMPRASAIFFGVLIFVKIGKIKHKGQGYNQRAEYCSTQRAGRRSAYQRQLRERIYRKASPYG